MLEFILQETQEEVKAAHDSERQAQKDFEDEMNDLKAQEASSQDTIADLSEQLNEKLKQLEGTKVDLDKTTKEHAAIEAYLTKIKPNCASSTCTSRNGRRPAP